MADRMTKPAKAWAVVNKNGRFIALGFSRAQAIDEACNFWSGWSDDLWREMSEAGYRCIRVTITEEPK